MRNLTRKIARATGALLLAISVACAHGEPEAEEIAKRPEAERPGTAADTDRSRAVETVALALDLAEEGREAGSPLLLLTAADLLITASPVPVDTSAGGPSGAAGESSLPAELDPLPLLEEARRLAAGQPSLLELARSVERRARAVGRGAEGGVRYLTDQVEAQRSTGHQIAYRGGEPAAAFVRSREGTELTCRVERIRDRATSATGQGERCVLTWWPSEPEVFRVEVRNLSGAGATYLLVTN